jgi:(R,R)-butanediol dehydrogenase / meso-butanediol dehydrogenase / diacetyl reductase
MRLATYVHARTLVLDERNEVAPRAGHVQIAVDFVSICGTDLQIYQGKLDMRVGPGAILGHEVSGHIAALGDGVTQWAIGQRVSVMPLAWCGSCPACEVGHHHLCHRLTTMGIELPGALQSSWNVPADIVVAAPTSLDPQHVALAEPAAIAIHALRLAPVTAGEHILIIDGGAVGLFIALLARRMGAHVAVVERTRHRRIVGMSAGVQMLDPERDPIETFVQTWTHGRGVDTAFEVSGEAVGVVMAVSALATRGRLAFVGSHDGPRALNINRVIRRELELVGASRYEREDFEEALRQLADGDLPLSLFVSSTEPLDGIDAAFSALEGGGVMRILIDFRTPAD